MADTRELLEMSRQCARHAHLVLARRRDLDAALAHDIRSRLGALSAALDVHAICDAESGTAAEALQIAARQTNSLQDLLGRAEDGF